MHLEEMQNNIAVLKPIKQPKINDKNHLQILLDGISKKLVLSIDYFANHNQQNTKRNIEPIGVFFKDNNWHLIAFCRLRNDYREFRVDRIDNLYVTDIIFNNEHPTLQNYLNKAVKEQKLDLAVILIEKEIYAHLGNQKYYNGFVSEKIIGSKIEMTFLIESIEGFARWFMMFADNAEIVLPKKLKNRVESIVSKIYKKNF